MRAANAGTNAKALDRAAKIGLTEIMANTEMAKNICSEDIIGYGLLWQGVQTEEMAALKELQEVVDELPCPGKDGGKLQQPMIEGLNPTTAEYLVLLGELFEHHDDTIFKPFEEIAAELGYAFHEGKPKQTKRSTQKAQLAYEKDYSQLKDLRRASIVCPKVKDIVRTVRRLSSDPRVLLVRKMNRFALDYKANDESAGYRDLQVNVQIPGTGLIWELQIHLAAIEARKTLTKEQKDAKGMSGHARYVAYREIMELIKQKQKRLVGGGGGVTLTAER